MNLKIENLKIDNLQDCPELLTDTIELISNSFNYSPNQDYRKDFYPQFQQSNLKNCFIVKQNQTQVIAHIGVLPTIFLVKKKEYTVNLIGSIAIKEEYRSRGLFKYFFHKILDFLNDKSILNILWSDKNELFEKFNFFECGEVYQSGNTDIDLQSISVKDLTHNEIKSVVNLYNNFSKKYFAPKRTIESFKILTNISSCKIKLIYSKERISGYFLFNKGGDLVNIIHEFISNDPIFFEKNKKHKIWSPISHSNNELLLYCALLNINNRNKFSEFYKTLTGKQIKRNTNDQLTLLELFGPNEKKQTNFPIWIPGLNSI